MNISPYAHIYFSYNHFFLDVLGCKSHYNERRRFWKGMNALKPIDSMDHPYIPA